MCCALDHVKHLYCFLEETYFERKLTSLGNGNQSQKLVSQMKQAVLIWLNDAIFKNAGWLISHLKYRRYCSADTFCESLKISLILFIINIVLFILYIVAYTCFADTFFKLFGDLYCDTFFQAYICSIFNLIFHYFFYRFLVAQAPRNISKHVEICAFSVYLACFPTICMHLSYRRIVYHPRFFVNILPKRVFDNKPANFFQLA